MTVMTSKQRMLAAIRHEIPDRVPAAPDISNYVPAKRTGLPFWDIYFFNAYPLWQAYLDAIDYFGADAWVAPDMYIPFTYEHVDVESKSEIIWDKARDAMLSRTLTHTPDGDLTTETVCYRGDPPTPTIKPVQDLAHDLKRLRWTQPLPTGIDWAALEPQLAACRQRDIAFGVTLGYPGFQGWMYVVQGGVEPLTYAEMDNPALLEEWAEWDLARGTRMLELMLDAKVLDYLLFGGSGTITLASPQLARKYCLPALKKWSRMCKEAGLPTMLHSCGKDRVLADMLAAETDIDLINPLEVPPMGDIDLAELKRAHGKRLSLMGNLHTTDVMLRGTPEYVRQVAIQAMRDAGRGGGFILSTGDQCGRETPDENLFALVEAAKQYGRYDPATGDLPDLP